MLDIWHCIHATFGKYRSDILGRDYVSSGLFWYHDKHRQWRKKYHEIWMVAMIFGDWRFFWPQSIHEISIFPFAWDSSFNTGIGKSNLDSLWITGYFNLTAQLTKLGLSWDVVGLLTWIIPALLLTIVGSYVLSSLWIKSKGARSIVSLVYTFNTFLLLVFFGGQMGVVLAYGMVPLTLYFAIEFFSGLQAKKPLARQSLVFGVVLAIQILFDIRIAYIVVIALGLYWVIFVRKIHVSLVVAISIPVLLHAYWLLPSLMFPGSVTAQMGGVYTSVEALKFFSFADFSHALSLLQPNWPDNIFGKTSFLMPEFLLIPLFAFAALRSGKTQIQPKIFFALLALIGIFLAKGIHEPFGFVYEWAFAKVPGMIMFRDPVKWYVLITLGYSMLMGITVDELIRAKSPFIKKVVIGSVVVVWLGLHRDALQIIQKQIQTPIATPEYKALADALGKDTTFYRLLWVPQWPREGYFSDIHPSIGRVEFLHEASATGQIAELNTPDMPEKLSRLAVKYIVVPEDTYGTLFQTDRKYDNNLREQAIAQLDATKFLRRNKEFTHLAVYELASIKDRFFWNDQVQGDMSYKKINPTYYQISMTGCLHSCSMVFSEQYSPYWEVRVGSSIVRSVKTNDNLNSFYLPANSQNIDVYYKPQQYVRYGAIITLSTVGGILVYAYVYLRTQKAAKKRMVK